MTPRQITIYDQGSLGWREAACHPPDTYEDFLLKTRGRLPREPSAAERARGQAVR